MHKRMIYAILISCLLSQYASAELEWSTTSMNQQASHLESQSILRYEFVNAASEPVTIANIKSSCGCTSADVKKIHNLAPDNSPAEIAHSDPKQQDEVLPLPVTVLPGSDMVMCKYI